MFKRLHLQLTFFCTLITSLILISMTCICLFIAESVTRERGYASFTDVLPSIISYLEEQTSLSAAWIGQVENSYHIKMDLQDNGRTLYSMRFSQTYEADLVNFEKAREIARDTYGFDTGTEYSYTRVSARCSFRMKGADGQDYYACTARIPKGNGALDATILYSTASMEKAIVRQRILFALVDAAAVLLLAVFSWFFTRHMIRPLEENRRRQVEFVAAASHELRSPLTVILSSLSAMKMADQDQREQFQETIQAEGQRMSRLIGDMLTLANADNGHWSIQLSEIELDTLLLQTYEKYELLVMEKGLSFQVELPEEDCPSLRLDGERIAQVLSILLDNALSNTPAPGKILLKLTKCPGCFRIFVSDTGPGIPDSQKKAVFERFYRADRSHKDKAHFGLGLCIASEIIKLHKGKISVEDTPGGGSTFVITLPLSS